MGNCSPTYETRVDLIPQHVSRELINYLRSSVCAWWSMSFQSNRRISSFYLTVSMSTIIKSNCTIRGFVCTDNYPWIFLVSNNAPSKRVRVGEIDRDGCGAISCQSKYWEMKRSLRLMLPDTLASVFLSHCYPNPFLLPHRLNKPRQLKSPFRFYEDVRPWFHKEDFILHQWRPQSTPPPSS